MTDYGHELRFGTFITPVADRPELPVALAQVSERAGLDLVTFQDHPYQPAFQDTWTLLGYVAASTRSISLSPNVLNLPLRPPAVVARAAASLDLLTGGRVELGIGAGGFWDAIAAMGGPRREPKEAVRALAEAIEIIRGVWDAGTRTVLKVEGRHYSVNGAKRGPAPAHPIGIWVGAYKPRMLQLTGRVADGWLPSFGYLQPGDLGAGNAIIDEAATEAGREPAEIRRLLNVNGAFRAAGTGFLQGPVAQWIEEIAELAIEDGIGTFILGTDDPATIEQFGAEVLPGVRELVAAERTSAQARPTRASASIAVASVESDRTLGITPTPDSGVRLSQRLPWDESTRPHRVPTDRIEYTDTGRLVGSHLVEVHDMLRSELAQVRDLLEQVRDGQLDIGQARSVINQMTMRQNNWTLGAYCESYCRVVTQHHSLEDSAVFPYLRARESELEPIIDRLREEHVVIHHVLDGVDRALVALAADAEAVDGVRIAMDLLTDTLLSHLSYEETELVEPLARYGFYAGQV